MCHRSQLFMEDGVRDSHPSPIAPMRDSHPPPIAPMRDPHPPPIAQRGGTMQS